MKLPSEADLIELERFIRRWQPAEPPIKIADHTYLEHLRVWDTLTTLIAIARAQAPAIPPMPPRNAEPEPVPSLQPKHKKARK